MDGTVGRCSAGAVRAHTHVLAHIPQRQTPQPQVASRVKRLRLACEHHALSLRNAFHVELMRIPKGVRQMSLKAFSEQYGQVRACLRPWVGLNYMIRRGRVCVIDGFIDRLGWKAWRSHKHTHTHPNQNRR